MKQNLYFKSVILSIFSLILIGCAGATPQTSSREVHVNVQKPSQKLGINAKKSYSKNESLKFSIDTGKTKGYVYVVYVDKKGDTAVLSSQNSTKKKKSGKLNFPEDFSKKDIKVTKECKSCTKEKTTVYVLLSNDPIENIENMNKNDLLSLNKKQNVHKNRSISLNNESNQQVIIGKIEFFVE